MTSFKDNFSKQAGMYARYRPTYPAELFEYLSSLTPNHQLAWDCGTGNGQSAISLTDYFRSVYATDPSERQIENTTPHPQITYKVENAEHCSLADDSADLITIAQALHWFDFDVFYKEVKRVLKPGGIIAAWAYRLPAISPGIDAVIKHFHDEVIGEYWQYENRLIDKEYSTIPFPFQHIDAPAFKIQKILSLQDVLGLVNSWSALQRFIVKNGFNPADKLEQELLPVWRNTGEAKEATWKLILRVGRNT